MAWKVIWTEAAWNDLEEAADYIARDSAYYASAFVCEAQEAANSLCQMAKRGRIVPEFDDPSIRELFVRNYRLIYKITEQNVYVIAFIHGSRNLWALKDKI